ncbi:MAG: tyrosine-type recombinase/integrase [Blautia sp.]|nr:tyrosine-type recombinase/integrase [Blautia sp.]
MGVSKKIRKKTTNEVTVQELFEIFQVEKRTLGVEEKTIRNYRESLKRFLLSLGCEDICAVSLGKEDVIGFIAQLQDEQVKPATINHYLRDLRAFFNWCSKSGYMEKIEIKLIKGQEDTKETYTDEELKILLAKPQNSNYCEWRSWAVINWILATGNREKTICSLKMKDINMQEREIILRHTKNKKVQIVPMSTELSFVLRQFIHDFRSDADEEDYLFCNVAGERLSEDALKASIRDYNLSRGVQRTSVHVFRHTFAKLWIRNGGDVFRLQKMLGHSTLDMTRKYVNLFSADLREGFDSYNPLDKISRGKGMKHSVKKRNV